MNVKHGSLEELCKCIQLLLASYRIDDEDRVGFAVTGSLRRRTGDPSASRFPIEPSSSDLKIPPALTLRVKQVLILQDGAC
jgi:hypothetical protein